MFTITKVTFNTQIPVGTSQFTESQTYPQPVSVSDKLKMLGLHRKKNLL